MLAAPETAHAQAWVRLTYSTGTLPTAWHPNPIIGGNSVIAAATHPSHSGVVNLMVLAETPSSGGNHRAYLLGCTNSSGSCGTYEWQSGSLDYAGVSFTTPASSGTEYALAWTATPALTYTNSVAQTTLWTSAGSSLTNSSAACDNPIYLGGSYDNGRILMVQPGTDMCGSGSSNPYGNCLWKNISNVENSWYPTSDGAMQLAQDGVTTDDDAIYALDSDGIVWYSPATATWTTYANTTCTAPQNYGACSPTNIGSATSFSQIAVFNGNVYGVTYCPGSPTIAGDVYMLNEDCWEEVAPAPGGLGASYEWALSLAALEVSNGDAWNGTTPSLWATDTSGDIWSLCPGSSDTLSCVDSSGVLTCTNGNTDSSNCGSCGNTCEGGQFCLRGACVCSVGDTFCEGVGCVDTSTNPDHCGSCGHACLTGETCSSGSCTCSSPNTLCTMDSPEVCTNINGDDPANCGACNTSLPGYACQTGAFCASESQVIIGGEVAKCCNGFVPIEGVCEGHSGTFCCESGQTYCSASCSCESECGDAG